MIYITKIPGYFEEMPIINNLWQVDNSNVKEAYTEYLESHALILGIIINPTWYNIMDWGKFHSNLSKQQHKAKEKLWRNYLKTNDLDWFIENILNGKKLKFTEL
jgi:hypothetical protein